MSYNQIIVRYCQYKFILQRFYNSNYCKAMCLYNLETSIAIGTETIASTKKFISGEDHESILILGKHLTQICFFFRCFGFVSDAVSQAHASFDLSVHRSSMDHLLGVLYISARVNVKKVCLLIQKWRCLYCCCCLVLVWSLIKHALMTLWMIQQKFKFISSWCGVVHNNFFFGFLCRLQTKQKYPLYVSIDTREEDQVNEFKVSIPFV